ncbi:hypothetical protein Pcac1_g9479 [Phytophthora cactorum]|nr:hypothetical protein Pcac1_g9479 [Phytophthora cactorum]
MMSSEEYEVLYTVCSELAKKGISPGVFGAPGQFSPGACGGPGPWGFRPWGFGPGPWAFGGPGHFCPGGRRGSSLGWMKDVTPAEMGVLMKYTEKGRQRAALGGILGASAMAGVWKAAALGSWVEQSAPDSRYAPADPPRGDDRDDKAPRQEVTAGSSCERDSLNEAFAQPFCTGASQ